MKTLHLKHIVIIINIMETPEIKHLNNSIQYEDDQLTEKSKQLQQYQNKLAKLNDDLNNLMSRIAGVTDDVLKEQLSEDFINLDTQISMTKIMIEDTTNQYTSLLFERHTAEHRSFYADQFVNTDIITCLEKTNNVEIRNSIKKLRLRPPATLKQKRELCLIANAFNVTIHLVDYEGLYLDYIGKGSNIWLLYCNIFSRFGDILTDNVETVRQKAIL
jgi:hypothetical protein